MNETNYALIRPSMSKKEFLEKIIVSLQKQNLKEDAIECLDPSQLSLKYLYGYQFKGNADCNYSCLIANDIEITINDKKSKIKGGTPISGKLDNCSFNIAVPCVDSASYPWANSLVKNMSYVVFDNTIAVSDPSTLEEEVVGKYTNDPLDFWVKRSNELLDDMFLLPAHTLASNSAMIYEYVGLIDANTAAQMVSMGATHAIEIKNLNVKTRNNLKEYGQKVLIPCYVLEFQYKGSDCFIAACVSDENVQYAFRIPEGNTNVLTSEEQVQKEMPEKIKILKIVNWSWVIAILVLFTIGFTAALICFAAWGIAKWYFKKDINARIKDLENKKAITAENLKNKLYKQFDIVPNK